MTDAPQSVTIDPLLASDWPAVRAIYQEGIESGNATFEISIPKWQQWDANHLSSCRLVARLNGEALGWAALSRVSSRTVYSGVAEVSVYVAGRARGIGIGTRLLSALVEASEREEIWTLQAGIFPENRASVKLHESCGFRMVGVRDRLGCLHGQWRNVLLMERRSQLVGV